MPHAVLATADGGLSWRLTGVAPADLAAIAAGDGGCAVGDAGTVVATNGQPSPDTVPPVSTIAGASSGWRTKWVLRLTAKDDGAGVAMMQSSVDRLDRWQAGARRVLTSAGDHAFDGVHQVFYRAVDAAGNLATARSVRVRIDTRPPTTRAVDSFSVRRGATARLPYLVVDRKPCAGWARVKVSLVAGDDDGGQRTVQVVRVGKVSVGSWHVVRFRCSLPRGLYICSVSARDAAGNFGGGNATLLHVR